MTAIAECAQVGAWDDVFLLIPFVLGVVFFQFFCPRMPALARRDEPASEPCRKANDDDCASVSTAEGSDWDTEEDNSPCSCARAR